MTDTDVGQQVSGILYCSNKESSLRTMEVVVAEPSTKTGENEFIRTRWGSFRDMDTYIGSDNSSRRD